MYNETKIIMKIEQNKIIILWQLNVAVMCKPFTFRYLPIEKIDKCSL